MGSAKLWENVIIFILIGIAVIFITPIIYGIFFDSKVSGAQSSTHALMKTSSVIYEELSMQREVILPFMVEYKDNGKYDIYEGNTLVSTDNEYETQGKRPDGGQVIIDKEGEVTVKNMRFENVVCNKELNKNMECTREK